MKRHKVYLGFLYKGSSYYEVAIKFTKWTLFIPIDRKRTGKRVKFYREMYRH